jgi:hypothetical protein
MRCKLDYLVPKDGLNQLLGIDPNNGKADVWGDVILSLGSNDRWSGAVA